MIDRVIKAAIILFLYVPLCIGVLVLICGALYLKDKDELEASQKAA